MNERGSFLLKFLDKYLGIPLIFILGVSRLKRQIPLEVRTIALLKTAAIGDTVLLTGIVKDLKIAYPKAKLILFTGSSNFAFAKLLKDFDSVEKLPIKNIFKSYKILKRYKIDLFLDFGAWPRINALFTYLSGAKFCVGFKTAGQYRHYIYDQAVGHSNQIHELDNYKNILKSISIESLHNPFISPQNVNFKTNSISSSYAVCHLSAGGEKSYLKELSLDQWVEICTEILHQNLMLYLTGASSDFEKNEQLRIKLNSSNVKNIAGIDLHQTLGIISGARCVVSINTGIMHIASCMGVKTIGIHGPTSIKRWGPIGSNSFSVATRNKKGQYLSLGFEYQEFDVMPDVSVGDVNQIINSLFKI